ncbi:MAG: NYN domain-containing protein [Nocardiopsaceae bacterium]|nr:NYN domain-containing protein [Nocardiopsaceae bacterium]
MVNPSERIAAYIDGFNLYFGIRQHGRRYLWLDLEALMSSLLRPNQHLVAVRYFTARVRDDPPAESRQQAYLNALAARSSMLDIREGRFQRKANSCRSCQATWVDYEEKETDVSLAVSMVEDGVNGLYDTAFLVSADSDMIPAVRALRRLVSGIRVLAVLPPRRRSFALATACDATIPIGVTRLRQSQLPRTVAAGSRLFVRPEHWK